MLLGPPVRAFSRVAVASLAFVALEGCRSSDASPGNASPDAALCSGLFGNPNATTGLTPTECSPICAYATSTFAPRVYDAGFIAALISNFQMATPYAPLTSDPYDGGAADDDTAQTVCGVVLAGDGGAGPVPYALVTYDSADAAVEAGASVTHFGHCGVCSPLSNLAVYMAQNDLTAPVRACALKPTFDAVVACIQQLGFDLPCAQAWAYDSNNTRSLCLATCLTDSTGYYNLPDGGLDPCIACDEVESGQVFKAVAGRTRRNSGLPNAICRPCADVQPLVHAY